MSTYPTWDTQAAQHLARFAHYGQFDKGGAPYIGHALAVSTRVVVLATQRGYDQADVDLVAQVAMLHDCHEDTRVSTGVMDLLGVPSSVLERVQVLSRPPRPERPESEARASDPAWKTHRALCNAQDERYCRRILGDGSLTVIVKEADIWHNMRPERLEALTNGEIVRLTTKASKTCRLLGLSLTEVVDS